MITPVHSESAVKVGLYYYVWYTDDWENLHKNCIDTPFVGQYSSQNVTVIKKHLEWLSELDIDFLIVSWWGINSYEDNSTKILFSTVEQEGYAIKLAILVEPFNSTIGRCTSGQYNFTTIYNYIYTTYVSRYSDIYMKLYNKPLLCFFNDENMTPHGQIESDNRFGSRIVGLEPYVNWTYCSVDAWRWGKHWGNNTFTVEQMLCVDGEINVLARFDDRTCNRTTDTVIDPNYTEGLYDEQWSKVIHLAREGKVNIVTITSWNEYAERTQIEPCIDKTSYKKDDPFFMLHETQRYIIILKLLEKYNLQDKLTYIRNLMYVFIAITVILIATTIYFARRKPKS